jgi:hypothetical protein
MAIADISAQMRRSIVKRELGYYRGTLRRKVSTVFTIVVTLVIEFSSARYLSKPFIATSFNEFCSAKIIRDSATTLTILPRDEKRLSLACTNIFSSSLFEKRKDQDYRPEGNYSVPVKQNNKEPRIFSKADIPG